MKDNRTISIVILSAIIILFFVAYYFLYGYVSGLGRNVSDLSHKLAQDSKQGVDLKNSISQLNEISPQIDKINSYFVSPDGEVAFIDEIEGRAREFSLTPEINSVQIENSKDLSAKGLEYLALKLSVKGKWSNVYRFAALLPSMPYQISVSQADIINLPDDTSSSSSVPIWQASFNLRVIKQSQ